MEGSPGSDVRSEPFVGVFGQATVYKEGIYSGGILQGAVAVNREVGVW